MILCINTIQKDNIIIALKNSRGVAAQTKIKAKYKQAEKLLPLIDKLLKQNKLDIKDIKKIQVVNQGGAFTALRVGVVTANALGYALGVSVKSSEFPAVLREDFDEVKRSRKFNFDIVKPIYSKEPNIT